MSATAERTAAALRPRLRGRLAWAAGGIALALAVLAALAVGRSPIAPGELPGILLGHADGPAATVFWNVRLPRVAGAMLVGGSLAAAGVAFQAMFRNPLASPDLLGVSAGASLGAVLGIFLGLPVVAVQGMASRVASRPSPPWRRSARWCAARATRSWCSCWRGLPSAR
jgi:iron complex transport system permease protein